jgi:hypothetical protein
MKREEFAQHEAEARDIIDRLTRLRNVSAPPDFLDQVMAKAEQMPLYRQGLFRRLRRWFFWPDTMIARLALATVFLLALGGAVPQYLTWIKQYVWVATTEQEEMWRKNAACSINLDVHNHRTVEVEGRQVEVLVCPSGDILVKVGPPDAEQYEYLYQWIALDALKKPVDKGVSHFGFLLQQAFAAAKRPHPTRAAQTVRVLCQKQLSNGFLKRRLQLADGQCQDEVIDPRTGKVVERKNAPCDSSC